MTKIQVPHGSVVVGVDGSEHSERALVWAAKHAALEHRPLAVLHSSEQLVVRESGWLEMHGIDHRQLHAAMDAAGEHALSQARQVAEAAAPGVSVVTVLVHEDARVALTEASTVAHLVVVGSRGRGPLSSALMGSVSASVVKHASCPVVVSRPTGARQPRANRVVVGTDGSPASQPVLEFAFAVASMRRWPLMVMPTFVNEAASDLGSELITCHTEQPGSAQRRLMLAESVAGLHEKYLDVEVTHEFERGLLDDCLADRAPAVALIVISRPTTKGWHSLLHKSAALAVLERTRTNLAVVPEAPQQIT